MSKNLYKVWNRLSSGSYFPPAVRRVEIPKPNGKTRGLGIPTIGDRVAQATVLEYFQPDVEAIFHRDSYGYRPNRSANDALEVTKRRCLRYPYVVEFDIVGLFDNIPHDLLAKAIDAHCSHGWVKLYLYRWLKGDREQPDGSLSPGTKGVPQGSLIGPVLSNLFMHYLFDSWMERNFPSSPICRYADDGLVHAWSPGEAMRILTALKARFLECGVEAHPDKTRVIDCRFSIKHPSNIEREFTFLGFTFRRRPALNRKTKRRFTTFQPGPSKSSMKRLRAIVRDSWRLGDKVHWSIEGLAKAFNPVIRGWFNYYAKFYRQDIHDFASFLNECLKKWVRKKFKKLRYRKRRSGAWLQRVYSRKPKLFAHWEFYSPC